MKLNEFVMIIVNIYVIAYLVPNCSYSIDSYNTIYEVVILVYFGCNVYLLLSCYYEILQF